MIPRPVRFNNENFVLFGDDDDDDNDDWIELYIVTWRKRATEISKKKRPEDKQLKQGRLDFFVACLYPVYCWLESKLPTSFSYV